MKIQSINNNPIIYKGVFKKKEEKTSNFHFATLPKIPTPSQIALKLKGDENFFETFLHQKGKVTKEDYDEIIKKHPRAIIKAQKLIEQEDLTVSTPKEIALAAIKLKEKYDKEYGENYTIASIGTSPAPITEVMSALGSSVKFIPASGLNRIYVNKNYVFRNQYPTIASRVDNVQHIVNYAKKQGITPNKKEYLIMLDYCSTGASLEMLCNIFVESGIYKAERIHDRSILNDLSELSNYRMPNSKFTLENFANIAHDMNFSACAKVSNVPHFYVYDEENQSSGCISSHNKKEREIFRELDEYSQPLARAYALCAIHEAMKLQNNIS